jgi:UDP-galactose transporter B1
MAAKVVLAEESRVESSSEPKFRRHFIGEVLHEHALELMESGADGFASTLSRRASVDSDSILPILQLPDASLEAVKSKGNSNSNSTITIDTLISPKWDSDAVKLIFGSAGIYLAYLSYGSTQEDVFRFQSKGVDGGSKFRYAWFLQVLESSVSILVGLAGRWTFGGSGSGGGGTSSKDFKLMPYFRSGAAQVFAEVFTSLALAAGLSFPVCIMAKSAQMVPVMLGQLMLGGSSYTLRDYCIAAAIVGGTVLLTMGVSKGDGGDSSVSNSDGSDNDDSDITDSKNNSNEHSNMTMGVAYIILSLIFDGVTAGLQKRLKEDAAKRGAIPTWYDFLLYTNFSMFAVAMTIAFATGDWQEGWDFVAANPAILNMLLLCCLFSAVGQSFIFYVVANFDPLVCSTVTTTDKIMSVVWSIATKGHVLSVQGSFGLLVAVTALLLEVQGKLPVEQQRKTQTKTCLYGFIIFLFVLTRSFYFPVLVVPGQ